MGCKPRNNCGNSTDVKVLATAVHEDKSYLRQFLDGAAGYVLKRAASEELIHALRAVAAGGAYLDPLLTSKVLGASLADNRCTTSYRTSC